MLKIMKPLPTDFTTNGMKYHILERTKTRYFAELKSIDTEVVVAYETGRIFQQKEQGAVLGGKPVNFEAKEAIVSNSQFGMDEFECAMPPKFKNEVYKEYIDAQNFDKNRPKSHLSKQEQTKVI
jgi:hypothetical protein